MERGTIAILATLDTKGEEVAYMKGLLEAQGYGAMIVDVGPLGPPGLPPDVSSGEVARLSGGELPDLVKTLPRDGLMEAMGTGAAKLLLKLYQEKKIHGIVGIGGNQGTAIASMAMRALPFGFPKYLVSTVASGNIRPYVGCKDIGMVFSVGDLLGGPNAVTRSVLANAVAAVVGMVEHGASVAVTPGERTV
ncbi:MAG TPA: Tm-1-like ATP-binding domain-containing protein, partial [Spirochaetia bacterium]|nr:Tm-1-like ATP-binding domain-containing protein [Spirochaetia bacterium]